MSEPGYKLTAYFDERDRSRGRFLADQLFDIYERHRMRTSVLLRGVVGFGQHHGLHTDRLLTLSESLPAVSIAVDSRERIEAALPDVLDVAQSGLISLERAWVGTGDGIGRLPLRMSQGRRSSSPSTADAACAPAASPAMWRRSTGSAPRAPPGRRCSSESTARCTASAAGRGSSPVTRTCR